MSSHAFFSLLGTRVSLRLVLIVNANSGSALFDARLVAYRQDAACCKLHGDGSCTTVKMLNQGTCETRDPDSPRACAPQVRAPAGATQV